MTKINFDDYLNKNAIEANFIMFYLYKITFPISIFFYKIKISPNVISIFSLLFGLTSSLFLLFNFKLIFTLFWLFSLILDFCDGTVARLSKTKSNLNFNIDHYFDLIKISFFFFIFSFSNKNNITITLLILLIYFLLFFIEILNTDLAHIRNGLNLTNVSNKSSILYKVYTILFSFNAHTLFLFLLFQYNEHISIFLLSYLVLILTKNFTIKSYQLLTIKKTQ